MPRDPSIFAQRGRKFVGAVIPGVTFSSNKRNQQELRNLWAHILETFVDVQLERQTTVYLAQISSLPLSVRCPIHTLPKSPHLANITRLPEWSQLGLSLNWNSDQKHFQINALDEEKPAAQVLKRAIEKNNDAYETRLHMLRKRKEVEAKVANDLRLRHEEMKACGIEVVLFPTLVGTEDVLEGTPVPKGFTADLPQGFRKVRYRRSAVHLI